MRARDAGGSGRGAGGDETCPVSTEGGTRRVHLVREGRGAGGRLLEHDVEEADEGDLKKRDTRRVRLVRGEGRGVSD